MAPLLLPRPPPNAAWYQAAGGAKTSAMVKHPLRYGALTEPLRSCSNGVPPEVWDGAGGTLLPGLGGADVYLVGCEHAKPGGEAAELILRERPTCVVVETGLSQAHEAETGAVFAFEEDNLHQAFGMSREAYWYTSIAKQLREAECPWKDPSWDPMTRSMSTEQACYVAALTVGAPILFGDRPKPLTYRRLLEVPTLAELDEAYAAQSLFNYRQLIGVSTTLAAESVEEEGGDVDCFTRVVISERDTVLTYSVQEAAAQAGAGKLVVAVVGESHSAGVARLWANGGVDGEAAALLLSPPLPPSADDNPVVRAVKRAIVERTLGLTAKPEVVRDFYLSVGQPEEELQGEQAAEAYDLAMQVWGSNRMLMAVLSEEELAGVCSSYPGAPASMFEALAPLRALRPVNGGCGFGAAEVEELALLAYNIGPPQQSSKV